MSHTLQYNGLAELEVVADKILAFAPGQRIFAIYGEMGAGKTTLIKSLCAALGIKSNVSSPTFSVINEYVVDHAPNPQIGNDSKFVYHIDFYRIEEQREVFDMGYEDYFFGSSYCFIEWPEIIESLLPEKYVELRINKSDNSPTFREITLNLH
ncbi:MAG: tRNA (adenosine(37)-N6)-threonylcarbamoyltransferase complex ATPase subunit type 1 TsaE [Bacteroidetes bacterium]|nr:MAG: tRNA (adenosine(37)-N6)-threonylcarbamoyltransferase complex ATPase subunit type 1 TsaE [Bacteroidota bacterium]